MYFEVGFVIVVILIDIIIMRIYLKQRKQSPPKPKVQKPTKETEDALNICIEYGLEANYQFIADCNIAVHITSRHAI